MLICLCLSVRMHVRCKWVLKFYAPIPCCPPPSHLPSVLLAWPLSVDNEEERAALSPTLALFLSSPCSLSVISLPTFAALPSTDCTAMKTLATNIYQVPHLRDGFTCYWFVFFFSFLSYQLNVILSPKGTNPLNTIQPIAALLGGPRIVVKLSFEDSQYLK